MASDIIKAPAWTKYVTVKWRHAGYDLFEATNIPRSWRILGGGANILISGTADGYHRIIKVPSMAAYTSSDPPPEMNCLVSGGELGGLKLQIFEGLLPSAFSLRCAA